MLPLHSLLVFLRVAETRSFSAAAKELCLAQPTISFHMDSLEKHLGCQLLVRAKRGVTLTAYGELLLQHAHKISTLADQASTNIQTLKAGTSGTIAIGASTVPGEYILPQLIRSFRDEHPHVSFALDIQDSSEILARFQQGRYALAIVGKAVPAFPATPLWTDRLTLAVHADCLLDPHAPSRALEHWPLILRDSDSGSQTAVLAAMGKIGLKEHHLRVALRVSNTNALKAALLSKVGAGFISEWAIRTELQTGTLRFLPDPPIEVTRYFFGLRNPLVTLPCIENFWLHLLHSASPTNKCQEDHHAPLAPTLLQPHPALPD